MPTKKHFASSLPVYEKLIEENPGNEEALFDEAQVACSLGLCRLEGGIYRRLLDIDPSIPWLWKVSSSRR